MRRHHIKIYLSDHNVIDAKVETDSLDDAVDKIATAEETDSLIGDNKIESIQLIDTEEIIPVTQERFLYQESFDPGYWVITDQLNGLACKFLERQFCKAYKTTNLDGTPVTDLITMTNSLTEMCDYIMDRHLQLIC